MAALIDKTFRGLSREYYLRQLFFGAIVAAAMYWLKTAVQPATPLLFVWLAVNTLLYPYARFVWESIVGFVLGANMVFLPALFMLAIKAATMFVCWQMAILIAPIGLAWLYWHHSRSAAA